MFDDGRGALAVLEEFDHFDAAACFWTAEAAEIAFHARCDAGVDIAVKGINVSGDLVEE